METTSDILQVRKRILKIRFWFVAHWNHLRYSTASPKTTLILRSWIVVDNWEPLQVFNEKREKLWNYASDLWITLFMSPASRRKTLKLHFWFVVNNWEPPQIFYEKTEKLWNYASELWLTTRNHLGYSTASLRMTLISSFGLVVDIWEPPLILNAANDFNNTVLLCS